MSEHGSTLRQGPGSPGDTLDRAAVLANVQRALFDDDPSDPVRIGRFTVLDRLGAGAMGVVYSAYDPQLDRKVALKLLLPARGDAGSEEAGKRLLREAQTLAKLSHPNVVAVHEAGEVDGRIFIAMAFVDGSTVGRWLNTESRPWREVLEIFTAAGRGLAAAHEAGLVHRDFKPDNVLIDDRGTVAVADFGLARPLPPDAATSHPDGQTPTARDWEAEPRDALTTLTRTGALVGTPAYMAPEQLAGKPATARSDQFSFCVALFEGLYGARPFAGETLPALAVAIAGAKIDTPPGAVVPGRIRRAVLRGLAADPEARWPDMRALLAELATDRARTWRRRALVAGALGAGAIGLATAMTDSAEPEPCTGLATELAGSWDDTTRAAVRRAFSASAHASAARVGQTVVASLDALAERWLTARTEACRATRVAGAASEATLDRRLLCLERARFSLAAAGRRFADGGPGLVETATTLLPPADTVTRCTGPDVLEMGVAPPGDPQLRAAISDLEAELAEITSLRLAGRVEEALQRAELAVATADGLGHEPTRARAQLELGTCLSNRQRLDEARDAYAKASVLGERGRADVTKAMALRQLAKRLADLGALDEARRLSELAAAVLGRFEGASFRAAALEVGAYVEHLQGRPGVATDTLARALSIIEEATGKDSTEYLNLFASWAATALEAERPLAEVEPAIREMIARTSAQWGADHPDVAALYTNLGNAQLQAQDFDGARQSLQRAFEIRRALVGADDPSLVQILVNHGVLSYQLGALDDALEWNGQAIEILERTQGTDAVALARPLHNSALVLMRAGRPSEALAHERRALAVRRDGLGPEHPLTADAHHYVGLALARMGRHAEALQHYRKALAIHDGAGDQAGDQAGQAFDRVNGRLGVSDMLCELRRCAEARAMLEAAQRIADEAGLAAAIRGAVDFNLARALDADGEHAEATELARRALARLTDGGAAPESISTVSTWLAARPGAPAPADADR